MSASTVDVQQSLLPHSHVLLDLFASLPVPTATYARKNAPIDGISKMHDDVREHRPILNVDVIP